MIQFFDLLFHQLFKYELNDHVLIIKELPYGHVNDHVLDDHDHVKGHRDVVIHFVCDFLPNDHDDDHYDSHDGVNHFVVRDDVNHWYDDHHAILGVNANEYLHGLFLSIHFNDDVLRGDVVFTHFIHDVNALRHELNHELNAILLLLNDDFLLHDVNARLLQYDSIPIPAFHLHQSYVSSFPFLIL
jgi:hypothetical protein